jgi:hypothetical protein
MVLKICLPSDFHYIMTMIQEDKAKHSDIVESSITYLEHRGFENIKADIEGYETPKSFTKAGSEISITPDIVATKEGRKHYFDISLKSEKPKLLKSKWLFLNTISNLKSHRFRIITKRGHYKYTEKMLDDINLSDKKLIRL